MTGVRLCLLLPRGSGVGLRARGQWGARAWVASVPPPLPPTPSPVCPPPAPLRAPPPAAPDSSGAPGHMRPPGPIGASPRPPPARQPGVAAAAAATLALPAPLPPPPPPPLPSSPPLAECIPEVKPRPGPCAPPVPCPGRRAPAPLPRLRASLARGAAHLLHHPRFPRTPSFPCPLGPLLSVCVAVAPSSFGCQASPHLFLSNCTFLHPCFPLSPRPLRFH